MPVGNAGERLEILVDQDKRKPHRLESAQPRPDFLTDQRRQSLGGILGANCLGVADSWNRVRIGGALGGDNPEEVLLKGSIAIFSNSGGFTTTIAQYLATE